MFLNIGNKDFLSPTEFEKLNFTYLIWDESTRDIHLKRIAWLVQNFKENDIKFAINIDFWVELSWSDIEDGNHRLAAAIYLKKPYILTNACWSFLNIFHYIYNN